MHIKSVEDCSRPEGPDRAKLHFPYVSVLAQATVRSPRDAVCRQRCAVLVVSSDPHVYFISNVLADSTMILLIKRSSCTPVGVNLFKSNLRISF